MAAPKKVDYARIEPAWRAGILSPPQLAAEYTAATGVPVSHTAIIKHFKKLGVPRDLSQKVKAKADSMVLQAMVTGKVSVETTRADADIINDSATQVAVVRLAHRKDIARSRALAMGLLNELEVVSGNQDIFEKIEEILYGDPGEEEDAGRERKRKQSEAFQRAMSLAGRTGTMKALADTLKTLVGLEREAFGLTNDAGPAASYEQSLQELGA